VTPENIPHTTVRRNEHLARVFHDLGLMEREGSGYDRMYEVLLSQGRRPPALREGPDRIEVTVERRVLNDAVIDFIRKADETFQLTQRERITLGLLAQHDGLTARDLVKELHLPAVDDLKPWLGKLLDLELIRQAGRTRGTRYFVDATLMRTLEFSHGTTLARIEPHRLSALVVEDLRRHPGSGRGEIHTRIGKEIPVSRIQRTLKKLVDEGIVVYQGERRWRRYWLEDSRR